MERMFPLKLAKLHLFQTTGGIAFFLGRRIVAPFALGAFQNNQFAHFSILSKPTASELSPFILWNTVTFPAA